MSFLECLSGNLCAASLWNSYNFLRLSVLILQFQQVLLELAGFLTCSLCLFVVKGGKLIALSHKSDGFDGSRKITEGEEGNSQSEILGKIGKEVVPFRSLRVLNSPPPSPAKSKATSMNTPAPPPLLA